MRVRAAIKLRCKNCKMLKRRGRLYVICSSTPKHRQRQG